LRAEQKAKNVNDKTIVTNLGALKKNMERIAKQVRRIERRDVFAKEIIFALKCRPRGVRDESR
jgi:hypothetical protein